MSLGNSTSDEKTTKNITKTNTFGNENVSGGVSNVAGVEGDVLMQDTSTEAIKSAQGTASDALDANRAAVQSSMDVADNLGGAAIETSADTVQESLNTQSNTVGDALSTLEWNNQQNSQKVSRALDAVESAKKGDGAETVQQLAKWGAVAVGAAAAAYALRG